MWDLWYLITLDKCNKVECKFCNSVILYHKNKMLFTMNYWHNGNAWVGVAMCSKAYAQMKALFATCGGIVPWPLDDMFIPTLDGSILKHQTLR